MSFKVFYESEFDYHTVSLNNNNIVISVTENGWQQTTMYIDYRNFLKQNKWFGVPDDVAKYCVRLAKLKAFE